MQVITKDVLEELYIKEKKSTIQIGKIYNCHDITIWRILNKYNIPIWDRGTFLKDIKFSEEHKSNIGNARKGIKLSEETKNKISKANKGKIPFNKGLVGLRHCSDEHKKILSEIRKGIPRSEETKMKLSIANKGKPSSMEGKHHSEESKRKMSLAKKGRLLSEEHKINIGKASLGRHQSEEAKLKYSGENNWNWKGGVSSLRQMIHSNFKYRQWRDDVFTRDNFTCQECEDKKGGNLEAHHIISFSSILQKYEITKLEEALQYEELWNINNGITLCKKCHKLIHKKRRITNAKLA